MACNAVVVLDFAKVYAACDRGSGIRSAQFVEATDQQITIDEVQDFAELEVGIQTTFVINFPRTLIGKTKNEQIEELTRIAEEWVVSEEDRFVKVSQLVKINPIFGSSSEFLSDPNLCFVLMPFHDDLKWLYDDVIKPTVEEAEMVCRRADEITGSRAIIHDIWKSLYESRLVIAVPTNRNPNVFYELEITHTIGKPTILISQREDMFPFDVYHIRMIVYENEPRAVKKLTEDLKKTIRDELNPKIRG
jgi:hypothetical protein